MISVLQISNCRIYQTSERTRTADAEGSSDLRSPSERTVLMRPSCIASAPSSVS